MPTATAEVLPQDTRMTLVQDGYLSEHGGRLKAGTVVMVDEPTAERWRRKHIAVDSAETDKTLREQKAAQLAALQAEIDQLEREGQLPVGNYGASIGRGKRGG